MTGTKIDGTKTRDVPRRAPTARVAVFFGLMLTIPVLVAGFSVLGRTWTPIGDEAVIALRSSEVATSATPLTGVYSTRGWAHPGPVLFYVLAAFYRLSGGSDVSMFLGAAVVHAVAVAATVLAAWRRGRLPLVAITAVGLALLLHGIRPDLLVSTWNPHISLLVYVLFLFAAWSVSARDWVWLPVSVGVGSALIQIHVAYVPLVLAAAGAVGAVLWLRRIAGEPDSSLDPAPDERRSRRPSRRCVLVTVVVAATAWAPVLVDLVFGSHNLAHLARYFTTSKLEVIGFATGAGILSRHLGPVGPWTGGDEVSIFLNIQPGSLVTLVAFVALAAALSVIGWRTGHRSTAGLMAVTGTQILAGAIAASRLEEPVLAYLVVWMLPLAMFAWVSVAWALWDIVVRNWLGSVTGRLSPAARTSSAVALVVLAVITAGIPLMRTGSAWVEPPVPRQTNATAVRSILDQLEREVAPHASVRVESVGDVFFEGGIGVIAGLIHSGRDVYTSDGAAGEKWGAARVWDGQAVGSTLTAVVSPPGAEPDPIAVCEADPDVDLVASFDALTADEHAELRGLATERFVNAGVLEEAARLRLEHLESRYYRIAVFRGDHVCS